MKSASIAPVAAACGAAAMFLVSGGPEPGQPVAVDKPAAPELDPEDTAAESEPFEWPHLAKEEEAAIAAETRQPTTLDPDFLLLEGLDLFAPPRPEDLFLIDASRSAELARRVREMADYQGDPPLRVAFLGLEDSAAVSALTALLEDLGGPIPARAPGAPDLAEIWTAIDERYHVLSVELIQPEIGLMP